MFDIISSLPHIYRGEKDIVKITSGKKKSYADISNIKIDRVSSSFGIALHMHQPTIPAETDDLQTAGLISNLQYMLEHQNIGDNHNAPVFLKCYSRMSDFIRGLVDEGKNPRVMLDYSGNLLWGLEQIENGEVLDNLRRITTDKKYYRYVEWLGTMWSHAVVSSTPVPDIRLHIKAWQSHFASIFGDKALGRVKGFSAPEMHLPIRPDVCYEYIKALKECGYRWLMVQEHTIENLDGSPIRRTHLPHRLIAKNSLGKSEEITVLIKTQGSDTKLVAQMQPYYEAKTREREDYEGRNVPLFVLQISDGENGGVMMNEFPPKYTEVFREVGTEGVIAMNGSEYLELLENAGVEEKDFIPVQPVSQHKIWEFVRGYSVGASDKAIEKIRERDASFNLDMASWTNDKNWVKDYGDVLSPINRLSVEFHNRFDKDEIDEQAPSYKEALLYLLLSQTSCFRYWGEGMWTEYAKEICRRGMAALRK
ncbi:MAG: glycosyl hydrolase family 57 [Candidatus Omnitrophica bacterium]|nr:glycosyl hydrolase family 57 [Candidatus Omnitrophota bacterium]